MEPVIKFDDEVLVSSIPYLFNKPKIGDAVAFNYREKILIKRIRDLNGSNFLVQGDNLRDSLNIGWIKKGDIIGKVIYKL